MNAYVSFVLVSFIELTVSDQVVLRLEQIQFILYEPNKYSRPYNLMSVVHSNMYVRTVRCEISYAASVRNYHIAGNFGEVFNLAYLRFYGKLPQF